MCQVRSPFEFKSILELVTYFKDEKTCLKSIEEHFWGGEIHCPHCGMDKIYRFSDGIRYKCSGCSGQFTLKIGTIFENSKVPLVKWFLAMYLISVNTRGCSTRQLAREIGVTQKTAWFMSHRIRKAFIQDTDKLEGVVAIDECFCGGVNGNRHIDKKVKNKADRTFVDKHTVVGFRNEEKIRCKVVKNTKVMHLIPAVYQNVKKGSVVITDEWRAYQRLNNDFTHSVVGHHKRQFISAEGLSTNGVENMWSVLKKMFYGTYNWVSVRHVQKYIDEFVFRFNNRKETISIKFAQMLSKISGALPYKKLVYG